MAAFAVASLVAAIGLQAKFGGSSFLPSSDAGTLVIDVRTPPAAAWSTRGSRWRPRPRWRARCPRPKATNSFVNPGGGRIYVDIGKSTERRAATAEIAADLRTLTARLVGAEYVVLDDLNMGAQKPVQIRFTGPDSRKLLEITNDFMEQLRQVPGAVDVGLSEQDPQDELKIELDRGLANALGISVNDAAQALRVAFAGVEVGDWVDPSGETRDVAVRLHPDDRVDASNIERLPIAVSGSNHDGAAGADRHRHHGQGAEPDPALRRQAHHRGGRQRAGAQPGEVTADALKLARAMDFPPGYGLELAGASRDQQEVFREMGTALVMGVR
jgi:hydrophobic/amphiphilic exporter-1 (mainly G- bacteria), HAE1 family